MQIGRTRPELPAVLLPISVSNFRDLIPQITQFEAVEARTGASGILEAGESATQVTGGQVTAGFFDLLGIPPRIGRNFNDEDAILGAPRTILVSDAFWRTLRPLSVRRSIVRGRLPTNVFHACGAAHQPAVRLS